MWLKESIERDKFKSNSQVLFVADEDLGIYADRYEAKLRETGERSWH